MSDAETLGVTVRFSVEDHRRLRVAAASAGGPMTELVRRLVLRYLDRQVPVDGEKVAGAPVREGGGGSSGLGGTLASFASPVPSRREQVEPRFKK